MEQNLLTRAEFAELAGVHVRTPPKLRHTSLKGAFHDDLIDACHPNAIAYLKKPRPVKTKNPTDAELYNSAMRYVRVYDDMTRQDLVDMVNIPRAKVDHIIEMLRLSGVGIDAKGSPPARSSVGSVAPGPQYAPAAAELDRIDIPDDIIALVDVTIGEVYRRFGTTSRFADVLKAVKEIEAIDEKRLKNAKIKGELVARELVVKVIDTIDAAHMNLLADGSKNISLRVVSEHEAGAPMENIENTVAEIIGGFLGPMKRKVGESLKNVVSD